MMRTLSLAAIALTLSVGCSAKPAPANLPTITIGEQIWLARNLDATHFANGDPIPRVTNAAAWAQAGAQGQPAQSAYGNEEARVARDGLLYNYAAISDPRGLCPAGFRIPTDTGWTALETTLGKDVAATRMKTQQYWPVTDSGSSGNGTDDVSFGGLPAGFRTQRGDFFLGDRVAYFWSLTELSPTTTTAHMLFDYDAKIFRIAYDKAMGMSVRCLKA